MRNYISPIFWIVLLIFFFGDYSQSLFARKNDFSLSLNTSGLFSDGSDLPFWLTNNRQGIFEHANNSYLLADLNIHKEFNSFNGKNWDYILGLRGIEAKGANSYFQVNEWFAGLKFKSLILKAGAFPEEIKFNGLSSTNADMYWSNNIHPMPRISLSTDDFVPWLWWSHIISVEAKFEEGFLNDERYVQNAHLHHKYVHLRAKVNSTLFITAGGDHFTLWGGTSPTLGKLPGFKSYPRYILGLPGSKDFIPGDQELMAGDQLAKWVLRVEKYFTHGKLYFYLDHPMDDRYTFENPKDNFIGLVYESNSKKLLSNVLFEFMYTNDQNMDTDENGNFLHGYHEYYFKHGVYQSGYSYDYRMICTPFMSPMIIIDGVNLGTGNNRVILYHIGLNGYITDHLQWKIKMSYSKNMGTFPMEYNQVIPGFFDQSRNQVSVLSELLYQTPASGWDFAISFAADKGQLLKDQAGIQFSIRKSVSF